MANESLPDWHLREWMQHFGKRQSALVNELGWLKGRASKFWNGQHAYRREVVNELAEWLGIEPFELLMPPHEALALRQLRETAAAIVADRPARAFQPAPHTPSPAPSARKHGPPRRTGTGG